MDLGDIVIVVNIDDGDYDYVAEFNRKEMYGKQALITGVAEEDGEVVYYEIRFFEPLYNMQENFVIVLVDRADVLPEEIELLDDSTDDPVY